MVEPAYLEKRNSVDSIISFSNIVANIIIGKLNSYKNIVRTHSISRYNMPIGLDNVPNTNNKTN